MLYWHIPKGIVWLLILAVKGIGLNKNLYVGFNCYVVFNNREIYGPFQPSLAAGSSSTIPSCHAEVNAVKHIIKIKGIKAAQKATYFCLRWSFNNDTKEWFLNGQHLDCEKLVEISKQFTSYFDNVLVMADDEKLRNNRLQFLAYCDTVFKQLANFEKVVITQWRFAQFV